MKKNLHLYFFTISVGEGIPALSHTEAWVNEFAMHFEKVVVITTHVSCKASELPSNVEIRELGGGNLRLRLLAVIRLLRLLPLLTKNRKNASALFHMSTKALLITGPFLKILNIPITLWYSHKVAPISLQLSLPLVDIVFTPTQNTFPLDSRRVIPTGHGLVLGSKANTLDIDSPRTKDSLIIVGRVATAKRIENILFVVKMCKNPKLKIVCIGPIDDKDYQGYLRKLSDELGVSLEFREPMRRKDLLHQLSQSSIIYSGTEGSVDKAPLEAAALGCFVITTNKELDELSGMSEVWNSMFIDEKGCISLEERLNVVLNSQIKESARLNLAGFSRNHNNLNGLVTLISENIMALKVTK